MELTTFEIGSIFPDVERIDIKVTDCYSWDETRKKEFSLLPGQESDFSFRCLMTKCIGGTRYVCYLPTLNELYRTRQWHGTVTLHCDGFNGYNRKARCEWFVTLDICLRYRHA